MGELKLESKYIDKIPKINIQFDKNAVDDLTDVVKTWGNYNPVVMINDYIPEGSVVIDLNISIGINKLPSFNITLNDDDFKIRNILKKQDIDTIVIGIGTSNWLLKFYGIIHNSPAEVNNDEIYLYGNIYNDKWYNTEQKGYKDKTVYDVIEELCKKTDSGLYLFSNSFLDIQQPYLTNPNTKLLSYFTFLIQNYSDCLWCYDNNGIMYIGNLDDIRKSDVDKFKIYEDNVLDEEKPIIISNYTEDLLKNEKSKFGISGFTVTSNYGIKHLLSKDKYRYNYFDDMNNKVTKPNHLPITNIYDKQVTVLMNQNIFEINPFSIVDLELYIQKKQFQSHILDEELSGKKVVIEIEYIYNSNEGDSKSRIQQKLTLI